MKKLLLCLSALIVLGLPSIASADTLTFTAPPSVGEPTGPGSGANQVDLDHHRAYTWRVANVPSLQGQQITSATLTFTSMRNWDANPNRLFVHLLDNASTTGGTLQNSSGGNGTIRYVTDASGSPVPVNQIVDYFGTNQGLSTGNALVAAGTGDTFLTSQSFSNTGSPNGANPLGAGWSFANGNYTYTFTAAQRQTLSAYFLNGNNFAFGLDPDCHFWNGGITFTVNTHPSAVPEPATMTLLGTGLAGLYYRRRRQQKARQSTGE